MTQSCLVGGGAMVLRQSFLTHSTTVLRASNTPPSFFAFYSTSLSAIDRNPHICNITPYIYILRATVSLTHCPTPPPKLSFCATPQALDIERTLHKSGLPQILTYPQYGLR